MKAKVTILIILVLLLAAEIGLLVVMDNDKEVITMQATEALVTESIETLPAVETVVDETVMPTETVAPTLPPETEPPVTEPKEKHYTLTFAGDCTFGSVASNWSNPNHFIKTIGENYDYPFANVRKFFENDDFTIINLEGPLTDSSSGGANKRFSFRGPTAYTQIMTGSSVEAVTLANNHSEDFGKAGYESTTKVLKEAGITYVEKNDTAMYTTESGLKIGLYAGAFDISTSDVKNDIAKLRNSGAEIVVCAFHWGEEGHYRPSADQQKIAKAAIDAGADIVYGHHPHVLQKIEQYKDGYIFYSLGNFSFGGAALPGDYDTAMLQMDVVRDENGKVSLGELTIIPCSISSTTKQNNFQPTPLEEGKVYDRVLSKLDGSFKGANLNVDYSKLDPKPETPDTPDTPDTPVTPDPDPDPTPKPDAGDPGEPTPKPDTGDPGASGGSSGGDSGSSGGGSSSSGDSGSSGGSSGGDSGSSGGGSSSGGDSGSSGGGSSSGGDSGSSGGDGE